MHAHTIFSDLQAVGLHSTFGQVRTGTMLACYLVAREGYSGDMAIDEVIRRRRYSIGPSQYKQAVKHFAEHLKGKKSQRLQ